MIFGAKPKNTSCGFEPIRFVDRAELERRIGGNDGTMERLTERIDGWVIRKGCHGPCRTCNGAGCADIYLMVDRLAAYEDTGLTPEEVVQTQLALIGKALAEIKEIEGITADRMIELAQAEKDGRLMVRPVKEGAKIYHVRFNFDGNCYEIIEKDFDLGLFRPEDFGRIIFRTREEAEAALKKREEDNEAD